MKQLILYALTLAVSPLTLATGKPLLNHHLKTCYVSSDLGNILPRANDLSTAYGGFQTAVKEFNSHHDPKVEFLIYQGQMGEGWVAQGIDWANQIGCDVLVGLVTSRDALLAAGLLKKQNKKLVAFSSTATTDELEQFFPYVLSASTSMDSWVKATTEYLKKSKFETIFVVSKPDDVYSLLFTQKLSLALGNSAHIFDLDSNGGLQDHQLSEFKPNHKTAVIYTTYPLLSIPSLSQIAKLTGPDSIKNWQIIGTQSWVETQTFKANHEVIDKLPPLFIFSPWDRARGNERYLHFKSAYFALFGKYPDHDSTYDYDVMQIILGCYGQNINATSFKESLYRCLSQKSTIDGSTGTYAFDGLTSHPHRKEILMRYDLSGMTPVE